MIIENNIYRIELAFFKKEDFEKRNMWVSKFKGIQRDSKAHDIKAIFDHMGGMNYYWRNKEKFVNDDNIYVKFKTENDLLNALHKNIHYKDFKIKGIKRGDM